MSKKIQMFKNTEPVYKLDAKTNRLVKTDEVIDLQEARNSAYDDTFIAHLERYFAQNPYDYDTVIKSFDAYIPGNDDIPDFVLDMELDSGIDKALKAFDKVSKLRSDYDIPGYISDFDVLRYIQSRAEELKKGGVKGGEKKTEPQSESQELPKVQPQDSSQES